MLTIDGSFGEGGGQIVRSALALSMITGQAIRLENIRARRKRPGLMRQHLTAAHAAARIASAHVQGDEIGSATLMFEPGPISAGQYHFAIGTAGSTTLVFQTVLPALLHAGGPSTLTLEGGTHNPLAPPFDFLAKTFLPQVNRMGPRVDVVLERPGFFPAGGGRFTATIHPVPRLERIELLERGRIRQRRGRVLLAHLPRHVGERELNVVMRKLNWDANWLSIEERPDSPGPGNLLLLEVESEHVAEVFTGFGQVGRKAESVATAAVQQCRTYLKADAPVGEYLADQLLLPMALAGGGAFRCLGLSLHATTHIELIRKFMDVEVAVEDEGEAGVVVRVGPH